MTVTLEELAALPGVVEQLRADVAELRARVAVHKDPDERIEVEVAAAELELTPAAIYKQIKRGKLKAERIGNTRSLRIRRGDLLRRGSP